MLTLSPATTSTCVLIHQSRMIQPLLCQTSSIEFLRKYNFDFNKVFRGAFYFSFFYSSVKYDLFGIVAIKFYSVSTRTNLISS